MNFTPPQIKLTDEKKELIEALFSDFYHKYAENALPGQVDFIDSVHEQFKAKDYLSDKQIAAIENILDSCSVEDEYRYENEFVY